MVSKAQQKAVKKYEDKAYFKPMIRIKKEKEAEIRQAAEICNTSLNNFIVQAIEEKLARINEK